MGISRTGPGGAVRLRLAVEGQRDVDVSLERFGELTKDWRPFFREDLAPKILDDVQRNVETEGGFVGRWAALSPEYRTWKSRHYPGKPILERRGALKASLQPGGPGAVYRDTDTTMELGTSVSYARFHQRGTPRMPQRRFLFLVSEQTYGRMVQRWALAQGRAAGLGAALRRASPSGSGLL
ncbi:MAG: phage virion morphogenesis protein [Gemmatimonadaceae bacterium]|nr:phage virion morphogenesis protein [Gemmatimonadaceae bacterium]